MSAFLFPSSEPFFLPASQFFRESTIFLGEKAHFPLGFPIRGSAVYISLEHQHNDRQDWTDRGLQAVGPFPVVEVFVG